MTDEELMLAVCNGDQSAYQTIVKKHLQAISHYAFRMLGSSKDTEDITQETFLRLWLNAAKWRPEKASLSTWLHRITRNLCIDFMRKHGQTETQADFDETLGAGIETDITSSIEDNAKARTLHYALQELPEAQRSALMLCHFQGFSNKEAAAIMEISVKALESALARARRTLKTKLVDLIDLSDQT